MNVSRDLTINHSFNPNDNYSTTPHRWPGRPMDIRFLGVEQPRSNTFGWTGGKPWISIHRAHHVIYYYTSGPTEILSYYHRVLVYSCLNIVHVRADLYNHQPQSLRQASKTNVIVYTSYRVGSSNWLSIVLLTHMPILNNNECKSMYINNRYAWYLYGNKI